MRAASNRIPAALPAALALAALAAPLAPAHAAAHDYPTIDRVRFVQECVAENPGPAWEMTAKCVCVVDALAEQMTHDEFMTLWTEAKATSIGGERGSVLRDSEQVQTGVRRWRDVQRKTKAGCFLGAGPR